MATSPEQLWLNDLDAVDAALDQRDADFAEAAKNEQRAQTKSQKRQAKKKAPGGRGKKKHDEWDSELELSSGPESEVDASDGSLPRARKPAARPKAATKKPIASVSAKAKTVSGSVVATKRPATVAVQSAAPATKATSEVRSLAGARKPAAKKAAPVAKATTSAFESLVDSDDDSVDHLGLIDRLNKKMGASPEKKALVAAKAKKPAGASKNSKKRPSPKTDDDDSVDDMDGLDDVDFVLASVTPAKGKLEAKTSKTSQVAKKARGKAPPSRTDAADSDADLDFHSDSDAAPAKKSAPARARTGRVASKKPVVYNVDSDDESASDDGSDFE